MGSMHHVVVLQTVSVSAKSVPCQERATVTSPRLRGAGSSPQPQVSHHDGSAAHSAIEVLPRRIGVLRAHVSPCKKGSSRSRLGASVEGLALRCTVVMYFSAPQRGVLLAQPRRPKTSTRLGG